MDSHRIDPPNGIRYKDIHTDNVWEKRQKMWKYMGIAKEYDPLWLNVNEFANIEHKLDIALPEWYDLLPNATKKVDQ